MGVTNGFLRVKRDELEVLKSDSAALEERSLDYDSPDYLEMDKAGYEILFILDPGVLGMDDNDEPAPYPSLSDVLGGGEPVHPELDLGYGPAQLISDEAIPKAIEESATIDIDRFTSLALDNEFLSELMMRELEPEEIKEYHWYYFQSLIAFLTESKQKDLAVLRY